MSWKRIVLFYAIFMLLTVTCVSMFLRAMDQIFDLAGIAVRLMK